MLKAIVLANIFLCISCLRININFNAEHEKWADMAFRFIKNLDCENQVLSTWVRCWQLQRVHKSHMNVYIAQEYHKLSVSVPDGTVLANSKQVDGVLAIDPYPNANFGHLVLIFLIENDVEHQQCNDPKASIYISERRQCMRLAIKTECENTYLESTERNAECETNFLPLVFQQEDATKTRKKQLLKCVNSVSGFGACPHFRPKNETLDLLCDPLHVNTHRCSSKFGTIHTKCRLFEICDQAIVVSGGWNQYASLPRLLDNTANVYRMLRNNGYKKGNIKLFFANGLGHEFKVDGESHLVYPSAKKGAIRYHINKMCTSALCIDTLVLYLNGPSTPDGSLLLWDVEGDGIVGQYEKYTIEELMHDLQDCLGRRVFIIADYSFSGMLIKKFNGSKKHRNVQIFASGGHNEYSWDQDFTSHWVNFKHIHTCVSQVHSASETAVRQSNPQMYDGSGGSIKTNIFGAPCNAYPPFSKKELQRNYLGCQTVPTKIWMSKAFNL